MGAPSGRGRKEMVRDPYGEINGCDYVCNLIHELSTIWSFTQTRDSDFVTLIRIKQVVVPVKVKAAKRDFNEVTKYQVHMSAYLHANI